jgi:hypothetical protein
MEKTLKSRKKKWTDADFFDVCTSFLRSVTPRKAFFFQKKNFLQLEKLKKKEKK